MKNLIFIILLFLNILSVFSQAQKFNDPKWGGFRHLKIKGKKIPRSVRKSIEDILFIEGGSYVKYNPTFALQDNDTNVLVNYSELAGLLNPSPLLSLAGLDENNDSVEYVGGIKYIRSKPYLPYYFTRPLVSIHSFWLSDHEVTNREYREFTDWVTSSIARKILAKKYPEKYLMPNTSLFKPDVAIDWKDPYLRSILFNDSNGKGMKTVNKSLIKYPYYPVGKNMEYHEHEEIPIYPNGFLLDSFDNEGNKMDYFEMSIYDDFPVIGVSWKQAMAYCLWRTDRLNEAILRHEYPNYFRDFHHDSGTISLVDGLLFPNYRLPTSAELEYVTSTDISSDFSSNTHMGLMDEDGNFLFNFGSVIDANGSVLKLPQSDGALLTARVKSYPPNSNGICDLMGNVSEWVLGEVDDKIVNRALALVSDNDSEALNKCIRYIKENFDTTNVSKETILMAASRLKILTTEFVRKFGNKNNLKFVKGGSWSDSPMYLNIFLDNIYPAQTQSMKVGFRIARDHIGSPISGRSGKPQKYYYGYRPR